MTEAQAIEAISARWVAAWTAAQPGVPFALGNEAFPAQGQASFAAVSFGPLVSRQLTLGPPGARRFEHRGTVVVRLHGALDVGEAPLAELAGDVRAVLESQSIDGPAGELVFATAGAAVPLRQGSWWTRTITIPFRFYERR